MICAMMALLSVFVLSSCDDDDDKNQGAPYFSIEGEPTGISVSSEAINQKFTVRCNRTWTVVAQDSYNWVRAFPNEGEDDGIFEIRVSRNKTIMERSAFFAFFVDGEEQPLLFRVDQEAAAPSLLVTPSPLIIVPTMGGELKIDISANVDWEYTVVADSWLQLIGEHADSLVFTVQPNNSGVAREATISFMATDRQYADLDVVATIQQASEKIDDGKAVGYEYFADDFSWLIPYGGPDDVQPGNVTVTGTFNMYSKAVEGQFAAGDLEKAFTEHGYIDINPSGKSIYFAAHYLKFGKTHIQSGIQRTIPNTDPEKLTNVTLTFDATPCVTTNMNYDQVDIIVEISGMGSVGVNDEVTKVSAPIDIRMVNQSPNWTWVNCSVVLYGINAGTQVTVRTTKSGTDSDTYRFYLDNLKFVKHSIVTE